MYFKIIFICLLSMNYCFFNLPLKLKKNSTRTVEINILHRSNN